MPSRVFDKSLAYSTKMWPTDFSLQQERIEKNLPAQRGDVRNTDSEINAL